MNPILRVTFVSILLWVFAVYGCSRAFAEPFDVMWDDRVVLGILPIEPPPATLMDEQQFKKEKQKKRVRATCLSRDEARKKYPGKYLSWRTEKRCWFPKNRSRGGQRGNNNNK